jgi:hypothetical protein
VFILSLPPDKVDKTSHQKEVISDSIKIAEDVIADVINGFNVFTDAGQYYTSGVSIEPLEEETKNVLAGVLLSLDLTVPYTYDACDLPLDGVDEPGLVDCEDATYQNSDGTFVQAIGSGATFTSEDITVTEVDGSTKEVPSNKDVTCNWKELQVEASDGVDIFLDGQATNNVTSYPSGGVISLSDLQITDGVGFNTTYPRRRSVVVSGAAIQSVTQNSQSTTITVPTVPSGIIYQRPHFNGQTTSYATGDVGWHFQKGTYNYQDTGNVVQQLDFGATAPIPYHRLLFNNAFGNKSRWTDSEGAPPDFTANTQFPNDDAEWAAERPNAIPYYVIDHLTGLGWSTKATSSNESWAQSIVSANNWTAGVYSDFRAPSRSEWLSVINQNEAYTDNDNVPMWDGNDNVGTQTSSWTGETKASSTGSAYVVLTDADIRAFGKSGNLFRGTYPVRNHF